MKAQPLRVQPLDSGDFLFVADNGRFFAAPEAFLDRFAGHGPEPADLAFLDGEGLAYRGRGDLAYLSHARGVARRFAAPGPLDYLILVPTLRCNLSCSYCQVSRAALGARGFDWSEETVAHVERILDSLETESVKIEFQGGEPTLRLDLIARIIARCERFRDRQFVICTNLSRVDAEFLAVADRDDVYISTSLDGDAETHQANRTATDAASSLFLSNLESLLSRYGPGKISALPTIDPRRPPDIDALIDSYASRGLDSIYLRPVNYHGFARKRHKESREQGDSWQDYYERFVARLIARNDADRSRVIEETYLTLCLKRIFQPGSDRHVDLRNPNPVGMDYIVIDHDGRVYPTDEARMLSRSGIVDLAIGDVASGWDGDVRAALNAHATNQYDPACRRCAYQPYCGRDMIDDLARYGRIDVPREETAFCRRHTALFAFIFRLIYSGDPAILYSLSRWLNLPGDGARLAPVMA
jgi:His-Xaa-Ser system radical SAM maturase HxsB